MESPKVFISYSWTTPEHEQRVLDIATELVESGIDAILDKLKRSGYGSLSADEKKQLFDASKK